MLFGTTSSFGQTLLTKVFWRDSMRCYHHHKYYTAWPQLFFFQTEHPPAQSTNFCIICAWLLDLEDESTAFPLLLPAPSESTASLPLAFLYCLVLCICSDPMFHVVWAVRTRILLDSSLSPGGCVEGDRKKCHWLIKIYVISNSCSAFHIKGSHSYRTYFFLIMRYSTPPLQNTILVSTYYTINVVKAARKNRPSHRPPSAEPSGRS